MICISHLRLWICKLISEKDLIVFYAKDLWKSSFVDHSKERSEIYLTRFFDDYCKLLYNIEDLWRFSRKMSNTVANKSIQGKKARMAQKRQRNVIKLKSIREYLKDIWELRVVRNVSRFALSGVDIWDAGKKGWLILDFYVLRFFINQLNWKELMT